MTTQLKHLKETEIAKISTLEKKMGDCVLAFEPKVKVDDLTDDEIKELQKLEKELNAVLVAYKC